MIAAPAPAMAAWPPTPGEPARAAAAGRLRRRTLILIRWIAILGQLTTLLTVRFGLGLDFPFDTALVVVGGSAVLNLVMTLYEPSRRPDDRETAVLLGWDVLQLTLLLQLTGGLSNPFAVLLLAPVAIAAAALPRRSAVILCVFAILCVSALALGPEPLPWPGGGTALPAMLVAGAWVALTSGMAIITIYVGSVAVESLRMSDALAATQAALAREQQLSAVSALAAMAAHELGTPLGTIALVAGDLAKDLADTPHAEDLRLLLSQTARCRDILARLAARPEGDTTPFAHVALATLVDAAATPHRDGRVAVVLTASGTGAAPHLPYTPEIVQGIGAFIENATQFARETVSVHTSWSPAEVEIAVADDGLGFALAIIDRLGEPYLSTRRGDAGHMGLGVFIASNLLERTGARVVFANRPEGGAFVRVLWPRATFGDG